MLDYNCRCSMQCCFHVACQVWSVWSLWVRAAYIKVKWLGISCPSFTLSLICSCESYAWAHTQAESVHAKAVCAGELCLVQLHYRLVHNQPYISELVKKAVMEELNWHCGLNNTASTNQLAYTFRYSCETILLNIVNALVLATENR